MLRPILFVWVLILVPKTCLWAQDTSPGNAQGCDPRELTVLLRPTDPAYAESIELTRELENRGYIVRCVLRSKSERDFEGQLGAALYRTNRGDFEALFLTKPRTFDSVRVTERAVNGEFYRYSFEGSPHAGGMEGRRTFFARRANRFFMTFDLRLAADLGEVLKPEAISGCYELGALNWRPDLRLGEDAEFITPPRRIEILAEHGTKGFEQNGYLVRPAPGVPRSIHRGSYWVPKGPNAVEVVWTTGFSGLSMHLNLEGETLRGKATTFWDFPRRTQTAEVVAHKVDCGKDRVSGNGLAGH
jgi:hypothetical protein